jgi:hypothetical protein
MNFSEDRSFYGAGKIVGFFLSYLVFTTMLFFVMAFTKKLPVGWNYINVAAITTVVALTGLLLKRYLR